MTMTVLDSMETISAVTRERPAAVICRRVTKDFGEGEAKVRALRGVDVEIPTGELALLVGESGCGKTTLISIIAGLLDPCDGEVIVFGKPLHTMANSQKVRFRGEHIGFVFQQYNLLPTLSAAENAAVPLLIAGTKRREAIERAKHFLDLVGLGHRTASLPSQLSGGQQQRVAIARALVHEPRLLVCDEPTAALDAHSGQTVMKLIQEVAVHEDRAVIVVTHDSRVFHFGNRIIHMGDGRIEQVEIPDKGPVPS